MNDAADIIESLRGYKLASIDSAKHDPNFPGFKPTQEIVARNALQSEEFTGPEGHGDRHWVDGM